MSEQDWKTHIDATKKRNVYVQLGVVIALLLVLVFVGVWQFPNLVRISSKTQEPSTEVVQIPDAYKDVRLSAQSAIVYDLVTGKVLYARNAEAQLPLASLTKLLTIYASADELKGARIPITASALLPEGDSGFTVGQTFTYDALAKLAIVGSSNDAAEAIALAGTEHIKGDHRMLASAIQGLGLSQTYTVNGTGLDESSQLSGGYGSAYDIAILAGAFVQKMPEVARATTLSKVTVSSEEGQSYTLKNTNPDAEHVSGLLLSKTGFTDLAGGNLAIVYDAGIYHPIAIVVLGSTKDGRFLDVYNLVRATGQYFSTLSLP